MGIWIWAAKKRWESEFKERKRVEFVEKWRVGREMIDPNSYLHEIQCPINRAIPDGSLKWGPIERGYRIPT